MDLLDLIRERGAERDGKIQLRTNPARVCLSPGICEMWGTLDVLLAIMALELESDQHAGSGVVVFRGQHVGWAIKENALHVILVSELEASR